MAKIETLPNIEWDSHAALRSAIESVKRTDKVIVLAVVENEDGTATRVLRSANINNSDALFELERRKLEIFLDLEG